MALYFSFSGHKCNCWLKIVNHWDKGDNGVLCTEKEIKSGLKLARMENTDMPAPFKKNTEYCDINIVFFANFYEMKVSPKSGLFSP